ncbi:MAG: Uma2 family endonuclease [Acidobacteriota bacterium]|nr:Uma2 family endonuclease [Acidobacteriota bacterium]
MPTTIKLITYEESLTMPENRLEEIIDGESYIMPPATKKHWMLLRQSREALDDQLQRKQFWISYAEVGLGIQRVPVFTYRIRDLAVFARTALDDDDDEYVWIAPALIVECFGPSNRRGRIEKLRQNYESIGVAELWLEGGSLGLTDAVEHGAVCPVQLPEVQVEVDELRTAFDHRP